MVSKFLFGFVLTLSVSGIISTEIIEDFDPVVQQQLRLMKLVRASYASPRDGVDSDSCFDHYFTEQDGISQDYNTRYNKCRATAQTSKDQLTAQSNEKRTGLVTSGNNVCTDLSDCEEVTDGLEFFNCYSKASGKNYPVLYSISVDSTAQVTNLMVFYQQIETEEKNCTVLARNQYVNEMAVSNTNLDGCLNGAPLPTTGQPTTTPGTETETPSSTEAPETTTPPATEAPSTTEAPEITTPPATEAPETTTPPATEAPETTTPPATTEEAGAPTTEALPEEDLFGIQPRNNFNIWMLLKTLRV